MTRLLIFVVIAATLHLGLGQTTITAGTTANPTTVTVTSNATVATPKPAPMTTSKPPPLQCFDINNCANKTCVAGGPLTNCTTGHHCYLRKRGGLYEAGCDTCKVGTLFKTGNRTDLNCCNTDRCNSEEMKNSAATHLALSTLLVAAVGLIKVL